MEDYKIQAVLEKAAEALERSRHFQSGTKVYQEFLARDAAAKALKIQQEKLALKKLEQTQTVHQIRLREAIANQLKFPPPSSSPPSKPKLNKKKKKAVTGVTVVSARTRARAQRVAPISGKPRIPPPRIPLESGRSEVNVVTSVDAMRYVKAKPFTIRNLRELMNKAGASKSQETTGLAGSSSLGQRDCDREPDQRPVAKTPFHKELLNSLATLGLGTNRNVLTTSRSELNQECSPWDHEPTPVDNLMAAQAQSETVLGSRAARHGISSRTRALEPKTKSPAQIRRASELNVSVNSINANLNALGDGFPLDFEHQPEVNLMEENFDHLAKIRPNKDGKGQKMLKCRFPPGIYHKHMGTDDVYFGYPYFTRSGSLVDAHADHLSSHYPSPGFKNDLNMTEVNQMLEWSKIEEQQKEINRLGLNIFRKN